MTAPLHLHDEIVRESGQRSTAVRQVDGMDLVLVVEDGVHDVDRELELVDPAPGQGGIEPGIVALRLLLVVLPVTGRPAQDVLCARRLLRALLGEDLVAEVVVHEVVGRDRAHARGELELAPRLRPE